MSEEKTYVWILETGMDYEGGYATAAYSTEAKGAEAVAQRQAADNHEYGVWKLSGDRLGSRVWHRPGEWMTLTKMELL